MALLSTSTCAPLNEQWLMDCFDEAVACRRTCCSGRARACSWRVKMRAEFHLARRNHLIK